MLDGGYYLYGHYVPTMDEMMEYQATREPWDSSVKYGHYTVWFSLMVLGVFTLIRGFQLATFWTRMRNASPMFPLKSRCFAIARLLSYPRLPLSIAKFVEYVWTVGPLGPNLLLFVALLFTSLYCWINGYYYRPPFYGSPPLALRSEWIATALIPFLVALGAKRNVISWLTGLSHDKLQIFHQGVAFIVVYMSLVHGLAEIVQSAMERPFREIYLSDPIWWSGFAALGPLIWLYLGSLPIVRKHLYESFYVLHIISFILFIGFLYKHGFELLDTNTYMNITLAIFGFSVVARIVMMLAHNILFRHRARVSLAYNSVRVTIPTRMTWSPGSHVFIRFAHIRPFESHPFTISSVPSSSKDLNEMVFLIRPESGFTRTLADVAATAASDREFPVILDGPYGDPGTNTLRAYDHVLLLAGGTGITFIASLLQDLVVAAQTKDTLYKLIEVHWAVKRYDSIATFEHVLCDAAQAIIAAGGSITVHLHITADAGSQESNISHPSAEKEEANESTFDMSKNIGRPDISKIVSDKGHTWTGHTAVAACGPLSFITDASNAVSKVQLEIIKGCASCQEMYLRSEVFGW